MWATDLSKTTKKDKQSDEQNEKAELSRQNMNKRVLCGTRGRIMTGKVKKIKTRITKYKIMTTLAFNNVLQYLE